MRPLASVVVLLLVGCGSAQPPWYAHISPQYTVPDWEYPVNYDFAEPFRGEKQFTREAAFEILLRTSSFSATGVGATGEEIMPQVYAFKTIAQRPDASVAFQDLLNRAQPAGKAYALCGLYLVDRPTFDRVVPAQRTSEATLSLCSGCTGQTVRLGEVVQSVSPEAVRLAKGQSLDDWFDKHSSVELDIVGGSYPAALKGLQ